MRPSTRVVAVVAAVGAGALLGCGSAHHSPDERGWFRSFAQRVTQNMRAPSEFGLVPVADPYVGSCVGRRAPVSWQAMLSPQAKSYPDTIRGRYELSKTALGRVSGAAGLPADNVIVIAASNADPRATDTLVLEPSDDSRVQVSVPDPRVLIAVGYVSC